MNAMELSSSVKTRWLTIVVLFAGCLLRFIFLDADPYYYEWAGYITDEGRWIEHARSYFLFQEIPGNLLHLLMAPIFQLIHYVIFSLLGVNMIACRIFTATAGSALLVLFLITFRRIASPQTLLLGIVILAFQADLVMLSRVAVPEMACVFMQLLIYVTIVSGKTSLHRLFVAGLLMLVMVLTKLTSAPMLIIFAIMIIFIFKEGATEKPINQKLKNLLLFWPVIIFISVLAFILIVYFGVATENSFIKSAERIVERMSLSSPFAMVNFLFSHPFSITLNVLTLGLWLATLGVLSTDRKVLDIQSRRYLITSAIWIILYFLMMQISGYFPTRYKIGILIPIVIYTIIGISLLQNKGIQALLESFKKSKGSSLFLKLMILSLPAAVIFAPLLSHIWGYFSGDYGRLTIKIVSVFISSVLMACVAYGKRNSINGMICFLTVPIICTFCWLCMNLKETGSFSFWPDKINHYHFVLWLLFLALSSFIVVFFAGSGNLKNRFSISSSIVTAAVFYMGVLVISIYPQYGEPHYSIREASKELSKLYSGDYNIKCIRAEGFFNHNKLRYRSPEAEPRDDIKGPKLIVIAFAIDQSFESFLDKKCILVNEYDIHISPDYYRFYPEAISLFPKGQILRVFRKKADINAP